MRTIKKLTPEIIKQIIAEEKQNVKTFLAKKMLKENKLLLKQLRLLKKINNVKPEYLYRENSVTAIWNFRKIVTSDKDTDNVIRKIVNKLLAKGTIFVPTGIINKTTGKINPPSRVSASIFSINESF